MKIYTNCPDAIFDLHRKGFTHDFHLFGNDLLWLQERIFIRAGEFYILECHSIAPSADTDEMMIIGVIAPYHNVKGILVNRYQSNSKQTPPVLLKKLNELRSQNTGANKPFSLLQK